MWIRKCLGIIGVVFGSVSGLTGQMPSPRQPPTDSERTLYFKLPLTQPQFHWRFTNPDRFLQGRLTLRIVRDGAAESIVVFADGVIAPGWSAIGDDGREGIYFGFQSEVRYMTTARDSLEIELVALEDLPGIGARMSGVLPAGTYRAEGSYTMLTGDPREMWMPIVARLEGISVEELEAMPEAQALMERLGETARATDSRAFMQCWSESWTLEPTGSGWLSAEQSARAEESERAREREMSRLRGLTERLAEAGAAPVGFGVGVDGRPCS